MEQRRRSWSAIPIAVRLVVAALAAGALVLIVVLLWGVHSGTGEVSVDGLTPSQVLSNVKQAASRDGEILHSQARSDSGGVGGVYTEDYWIDGDAGTMRLTYTPIDVPTNDGTATVDTILFSGKYEYVGGADADKSHLEREDAQPCSNVSPVWLSYFLLCQSDARAGVSPEISIEAGDWKGTAAVVLVFKLPTATPNVTPLPSPMITAVLDTRVYLDPSTYLPLGVKNTVDSDAYPSTFLSQMSYTNEFLPRTPELLATLDPKSVGYGTTDVDKLGPLSNEITVYWLGENYEPDNSLYALVLSKVDTARTDSSVARLTYGNRGRFGGIDITLWKPDVWAAKAQTPIRQLLDDPSCVSKSTRTIGGRDFTLYQMMRINYPVPSKGSSAQADCWWRGLNSGSDVDIQDGGSVLVWETGGVVVEISADPTGYFVDLDVLSSAVATLQKY